MKKKELVKRLSDALCNCLVNAEENKEAVRALGAKPAVLRGMAYGMAVAVACLEDDSADFDGTDAGMFVGYAAMCESERGLDLEKRVGRLIGHTVSIKDEGAVDNA